MSTCRLVQPSLWHDIPVAPIGVINKAYVWQEQPLALRPRLLWIEVDVFRTCWNGTRGYPDAAQTADIALTLALSVEQAAALHLAISDIVRNIRVPQETKERFGPDSPAVAGLRRMSPESHGLSNATWIFKSAPVS